MFVVIGTTTVDLVVHGMPTSARLADGFRADNLVFCDESTLMLMGGNGGNSAYVLGRLGLEAAICSSVGQDDMGDWLAAKLAALQVNLDGLLRQPDLATSSSTILLDNAENQAVFHHKGATDAMSVSASQELLFAQAEVLLASSYTLFPRMRAGGFAQALRTAHKAGGITALDIGPAIGELATLAEVVPLFPYLDFLIANTHELERLTGKADWEAAAMDLLGQGCRCVIVKKGSDGAAVRAHELELDAPAFPVSANISVGAGDSFNAGFLYALWASRPLATSKNSEEALVSSDKSPEPFNKADEGKLAVPEILLEALRFGNAVAALVVSGQRGVLSAPTLAEVTRFLQE